MRGEELARVPVPLDDLEEAAATEASGLNAARGAGVPKEEGPRGPVAARRHRAALLAGAALGIAALGAAAVAAGVAPKPPRRSSTAEELMDRGPLVKDERKDECAACSGEFSNSGVIANPKMLGGAMTFEDVQKALRASCPEHCGKRKHRGAEESEEQITEDYLKELANSSFKCSTAKRGEMCYDLVEWTVTKVLEDPDFYKGISAAWSPEQVQLRLHSDRPGICPLPCLEGPPQQEGSAPPEDGVAGSAPASRAAPGGLAGVAGSAPPEECHTAERDEDCFSAIIWVLKEGIFSHPKLHLGLNAASTFEEVQEHVHKYPGDGGRKCPKPCKEVSCRDAFDGEPCFGAVKWALDKGIANHPDWFKGLSADSTFAEVQMNLYLNPNATVACPRPCSYCHTAVPGERCHSAVAWVMQEGIEKHPECYEGLRGYSSFQEVQHHLWKNISEKSARCQKPCAVVEPDGPSAVVK